MVDRGSISNLIKENKEKTIVKIYFFKLSFFLI